MRGVVMCGESQCKVKSRRMRTGKLEAIAYDADASVAPAFAEARATCRALPTPYHVPVSHMDPSALHSQRTACGTLRQDARDGVKATAIRPDLFALLFAGAFLHQARLENKQQTLNRGHCPASHSLTSTTNRQQTTTSRSTIVTCVALFRICHPHTLTSLATRPTRRPYLPATNPPHLNKHLTSAMRDARIKRCSFYLLKKIQCGRRSAISSHQPLSCDSMQLSR
jgi:hypothetical protein